jgi:serine/threonine-protein kinase
MALDPNRFDEFVIESMIGEGGMGKGYRARQTALDRWVALKVLPRAKENRNFIERFYREARSAARLVHPNIIQIHTVGEVQGVPYYTMEYVEGDDLEHIIRDHDNPLTIDAVLEVTRSVVKALGVASEQGVVHRDIKPANIMVSKTGLVKVMDFGLAKEMDHNITQSGVVVGTPTYMSPEQGSGQTVDFRSDLYSLGCVLYECIKGVPPFHAEKVASVIYKHMFEPPPPLGDADHPVDPELEMFVMRALAKKPEDRYSNSDATLEALSKLPYNAGSAELELSKRAQNSLKARKMQERRSVSKDPDAPRLLVGKQEFATKHPPPAAKLIESKAPEKPKPVRTDLPPTAENEKPPIPPAEAPKVSRVAPVAPLGQLLAEKAKFIQQYTQPPAAEVAEPIEEAPPPAIPAAVPAYEKVPTRPAPKPLNRLKPPPRKESSGAIEPGRRPPSINAPRPSAILEEAEIVERKTSAPVMRIQTRPTSVSAVFVKLPDGRWSYSRHAARCERAEGLATQLLPIPIPEGRDRGLGDCLLCPNWNKRTGCAAAFAEELLVKGRYNGLKLLTEQAVAWIGAGRFDRAITLFNEFIEDNPDNPQGYRELARIYDRPDYKGRDKRRAIILYSRYVELARERGEGSKIEIARAEARANALRNQPPSYGGAPMGESLEFDCFYRGAADCYAYCRLDMLQLVAVKAGDVDPQTGLSEPDPNAGVSAFRRVKSIFAPSRTEQEKQEDQSAVRRELTRLSELDSGMIKRESDIVCVLNFDAITAMELGVRPPDLSVVKMTEKGVPHSFVFTVRNAQEGQQVKEFMTRRLARRKSLRLGT